MNPALWLLAGAAFASPVPDTPVTTLPDDLQAAFLQAEDDWQDGRLLDAERGFEQIITAAPTFDRALRRRCGVLLQLGERDAALPLCDQAHQMRPSAENAMGLARVLLQPSDRLPGSHLEDLDRARTLIDATLEDVPDSLIAWQNLCLWSVAQEDLDTLGQCAAALERLDPQASGTLYHQALWHMESGRLNQAARHLEKAIHAGLDEGTADAAEARLSTLFARAQGPTSSTSWLPWLVGGSLAALLLMLGLAPQRSRS